MVRNGSAPPLHNNDGSAVAYAAPGEHGDYQTVVHAGQMSAAHRNKSVIISGGKNANTSRTVPKKAPSPLQNEFVSSANSSGVKNSPAK